MKRLLIAAILALFCGAWWSAVTTSIEKPIQYRVHIRQAEEYEEKEIYYDAILEYQDALEYDSDNMELYLKIAQDYKNLGDMENFEQTCSQAIQLNGDNEKAIFMLTDYYLEEGRKEDAIALLKRQIERKKNNGAIKEKLQSLAGGYQILSGEYGEISNACSGYMKVENEDGKGLLDLAGHILIRPQYEEIGLFGENGFAPVKKQGAWYYIDKNNYKRRVPEENYEIMGIINQGIVPAKKEEKWGYLDGNFQELTEFVYDAATPMLNSVAGVQQGEKWALIGKNLKFISNFEFDEIVTDEWGFCSRNGVIFVKKEGKYLLVDSEGKQVGKEYFDEVSPFLSKYPTAVRKGDKWGFVSTEGEIVLNGMYQEAGCFTEIGYAPAKKDGLWGYIKNNGDFIIPPEFEDAKSFDEKGIAPVRINGSWKLIQLDTY